MNASRYFLRVALLAMLVGGMVPAAPAATAAGEVLKISGRAWAATAAGQIQALAESEGVHSGDTVVTGSNSFVRLKMADGGFIVLRPNTRFLIEDFEYAAGEDSGRSLFNLLKGGFRAVTGAIGRRNHANVSFRTAVATIGIRGTDIEVIDCSQGCPDINVNLKAALYFKVHQGGIGVNGRNFDQNQGGYMPPGGAPENLDFQSPDNPLNADPTPSADPADCL